MCGRYTLIRLADFTDMFPWIRLPDSSPPARYNIAPTQAVAVVPNVGNAQVDYFRWGLVPSWAKDPSVGSRMINARVETAASKPAFRTALKRRRCLVPASGFYEWKKSPDGRGPKTPMYIRLRGGTPFAFAGLWESWQSPDGSRLLTCTILTGAPNGLVSQIHDRMAVILRPEHMKAWIEPGEADPAGLVELLQPYPADLMEAYPVGRDVNSPTRDGPGLIERVSADRPTPPVDPPANLGRQLPRRRNRVKPDDEPQLF